MNTRKLIRKKQLFSTWLDLFYADKFNEDTVNDIELQLKDSKKHRAATKRLLKRVEACFEKLYGKKPTLPKRRVSQPPQ